MLKMSTPAANRLVSTVGSDTSNPTGPSQDMDDSAGSNAGSNAGPDAGPDVGPDDGSNAGSDAGLGPNSDACPGADSAQAGLASACAGCPSQSECAASANASEEERERQHRDALLMRLRLAEIKRTILVMSGKGGVGKSTVAAQLAWTLSLRRRDPIAALDIDLCGPSMAKMLGVEQAELRTSSAGWTPVAAADNLQLVSMAFLLPSTDSAVVWRGPRKNGIIAQFLRDVEWGPTSYLIVDTPPGTSDEHLTIAKWLRTAAKPFSVAQDKPASLMTEEPDRSNSNTVTDQLNQPLDAPNQPPVLQDQINIPNCPSDGQNGSAPEGQNGPMEYASLIVTTAQAIALADVRRQISFCRKAGIPILGIIENMSGFVCPQCNGRSSLFPPAQTNGGAKTLCDELNIPFLGSIPLDPTLAQCSDRGIGIVDEDPSSPTCIALAKIIDRITTLMPV